ncbi:MAG: hypothetical protein Q8K78_10270 [Planctomycetaceae bacterium]|nr:hypothetical protein [Planctomycetaceae bacterium]
MAIFWDNAPCSLCDEPIRVGDDTVATTYFIGDHSDPLYRYSDSVMHRPCFDCWEFRDEFVRRYRKAMGFWHCVGWPGRPGGNIVKEPPPLPPPVPPTHFCVSCNAALTVATQGECANCGWLRYQSDRSRWGKVGVCPHCGFGYRWDGVRCSHCGCNTAVV